MGKQTKPEEEQRRIGPKFARSVLPENYQIRRQPSPMAELLREAEGAPSDISNASNLTQEILTPVNFTPEKITTVEIPVADLPDLDTFLDQVLIRFPAVQQAILLRLYRWSDGKEKDLIVSTPRLAAKTNMDEKSVRTHIQSLVNAGYLIRSMDGMNHAKYGGHDRQSRGLLLRMSAAALNDLIN